MTTAVKNVISAWVLDPLQALLAQSPWYGAALAILAIAIVLGGRKAILSTVVCLAGIRFFDLWNDAMVTWSPPSSA